LRQRRGKERGKRDGGDAEVQTGSAGHGASSRLCAPSFGPLQPGALGTIHAQWLAKGNVGQRQGGALRAARAGLSISETALQIAQNMTAITSARAAGWQPPHNGAAASGGAEAQGGDHVAPLVESL
jgi:hypothetical protein